MLEGYYKRFIEAICDTCKICPNPTTPKFCSSLYEANRPRFMHHIIYKVCLLREANPKKLEQIKTFEGFCALFCKPTACPKYDKKECKSNLSKRVSCYDVFLRQLNRHLKLNDTSTIFSSWSGIDLSLIGSNLKLLDDLQYLAKRKKKHTAKKIRKIMRKMHHGLSENFTDKNKTIKIKKKVSTLLFHNQDDDAWGEKLKEYLNEDNNRQQSKAGGTTG